MVKNLPASVGDAEGLGLIPGLGRSPGVGTAMLSSILAWEIPETRGTWWTTVHGAAKSQTLSIHTRNKIAICLFLLSLYFFYVFAETVYFPFVSNMFKIAC